MSRLLVGVLLVMLAGCGPGGAAADGNAPLTADQRVAWEKLRRQHDDGALYVAGCLTDAGGWRMCDGYTYDGFTPLHLHLDWSDGLGTSFAGYDRRTHPKAGDDSHETARHQAQGRAMLAACQPNVKAVVVLDLFGGPDPKVAAWFADDGKGAKELEGAPSAELDASLRDYLRSLQTNADRL